MHKSTCPHCDDWNGDLETFHDTEGGMIYTACPRCVDAELKKSKVGQGLRAKCDQLETIRKEQDATIQQLSTELDIRVLNPDWKSVCVEERVMPGTTATLIPNLRYTPYFLPKAARITAVKVKAWEYGRFSLQSLRVGGADQEHDLVACDFRKPLRVNWSMISATGLAREMRVQVKSEEETDVILASVTLWGEPYESLDSWCSEQGFPDSRGRPWRRGGR